MATNPSTAFSYTNKDFQTLYTELLDTAKKLSAKWDPSISNESDPGVVLLKLNAIIGDKNNYNIDRNILEYFPETASQEINIRNIYKQLGYNMPWYRSGSGEISLQWKGTTSSASVTLPQFTSFSNDDYTIVYTLKENTVLPLDGSTIEAEVIGGIATQLQVAGAYTLYTSNLNSKNRLYFSDYQVAENGIFIFSYRNGVLQNDYTEWTRVDNLLLEPLGSKVYEFGIDSDYNMPYLEFPEDIDSLIPEGMEIWYTISNGEAENIPAFVLTKPLLSEMTLTDSNGDTRSISSDTLYVINYSSIINNKDAETIEQAANSYKKTLGTFSTLVTLRDYINAIYNSGLISNGTVSDRTTDLQDSSRVVTTEGTETVFKAVTNDMAPFDLKLYVLQYVGTPSTYADYNTGFTLVSREAPFALTSYLENEKCIQHDFIELQKNKICFLKNCYKISTTIIPTQTLNSEQTNNLRSVIQNALFEKLNSNAVDFGEEVGFRKVFEVIEESSPFIKSVSLDSIVYNTYATYFDENDVQKEIVVSNEHPYVEGYAYTNGSTIQFFSDEEHTKAVQGTVNSQYLDISTGDIYSYASGTYSLYSSKRNEFRKEIYNQCVLSGCTGLFDFQEDFDYTVLHKFLQSTKTKDVSTRSVVELSTNESYTVHPNEVIQFYAPAYSDVTSYSTYVKYVFYSPSNTAEELETPKEITPDSIYTLGEGEYIVFLWKNSEEDLRYTYHKYAAGTILYSNVTLTQDATAQVYTNGLSDNIEGKIIDTSANNFFAGYQDNVLTSNSSVTIKSALKDTLNNSVNQCYFITNDRVVGSDNVERSVLFGEPSIKGIYDTWDSTDTKDDFTVDVGKFYTATNGGNSVMNIQFDADENKWVYEGTKTSLSALGITYSKKYGATDYYTYEVPTVSTSSSSLSPSISNVSQAVTQLHSQSEYVVFKLSLDETFSLIAPASLLSNRYTPTDFGINATTVGWQSNDCFCIWLDTSSMVHISKCTYSDGITTLTSWGHSQEQVISDFDKCYEKMYPLQRIRTYTYSGSSTSWTPDIDNTGIYPGGEPSDGDTITLRLESQNIYVSFDTASSDEHLFVSGEYFLYKDGTQLKICGPGTLIKRTATNENTYPQPWQCVVKSAEDILEYGLNAFTKNDWLQFYKNNYTITISEVQFLNLLEGDTLQLSSSDSKLIVDDKNSSTISATIRGYSSQESPYSIDVTTAREFLASEGYPNGTYSCTPSVDGISTTSRINVPTGSTYAGTVTSIDGQKLYDMLTYTGEVTFSSRMVENTCYWEASQGTSELFTTTTLANDYGIVISQEPSDDQVEIVVGIAIISNSKFDVTCEEIDGTVWDFHLTVLASALGIEDTTEEFSDYALITINYGSRFTNGIDISYIVSGETTSQNLPTVPAEDSYRARTILNLIIGPTQPQTLYPNQFVTLTPEDGSSDVTIHDEDEVVTVVSDVNLSIDGGEDVDVTLIDSIGDIDYPVISSYKFGNNEYSSSLIVNGNTFIFTVAPGEIVEQSTDVTPKSSTYHFNFAYPEGNYILPLYNPFDWSAESDGHVEVFLDHEPTLDTQSLKFETIAETNRDGHDIAFNKLIENEDSIEFTYDNGFWWVGDKKVNLSDYGLEEADSSRANTRLGFGNTFPVMSSSSSVTVSDSSKFISKVGQNNFANYDFIYDSVWKLDGIPVSLKDYGISVTQGFESNFTIQYMPHQLFEIDNTISYNFRKTGYHYILLPVMKNIEAIGDSDMVSTQHTIRFYFRNPHASTYTSTLYGSDRIVNPENCGEILSEASDIKTSLSGQDIKFKYNYRPGENKIEDPLASTSFLNKNHIYNKFTICKATTPFVIQIVK